MIFVLTSLLACNGGNPYTVAGFHMSEFFPFDGTRSWTFVSDDPAIPYQVFAELQPEPEVITEGDAPLDIFTVTYNTVCVGSDPACVDGPFRVSEMQWSSKTGKGVRIHGYATPDGGHVTLDPPFTLAGSMGKAEDAWTTEINGATWTSTFTKFVAQCPVLWSDSFVDCPQLDVDAAGAPIGGTWYAATGWGLVGFAFEGESVDADGNPYVWKLLRAEFTEAD
jgi:hypothetical protein